MQVCFLFVCIDIMFRIQERFLSSAYVWFLFRLDVCVCFVCRIRVLLVCSVFCFVYMDILFSHAGAFVFRMYMSCCFSCACVFVFRLQVGVVSYAGTCYIYIRAFLFFVCMIRLFRIHMCVLFSLYTNAYFPVCRYLRVVCMSVFFSFAGLFVFRMQVGFVSCVCFFFVCMIVFFFSYACAVVLCFAGVCVFCLFFYR